MDIHALGMLAYELGYLKLPGQDCGPHELGELSASRDQLLDLDIQYVVRLSSTLLLSFALGGRCASLT